MKLDTAMRAAVDAHAAELDASEREDRSPRERPIDDMTMMPDERRRAHQARTLARIAKAQTQAQIRRGRR